ncbi:MAG: thrombospondin type 3 repeat-containing protein [Gammaproteobacteria bacterium]
MSNVGIFSRRFLAAFALLGWSLTASAALNLRIELNPNPVRPAESMLAELTVTNDGASAVTGVTLDATMPTNVSSININVATPTATCIQSNTSGACDPGELVHWVLGTIPAGGGTTVSLPLTVTSAAPAGTVITLAGNLLVNAVSNQTANASTTVSTGNALSLSVDEDKHPVAPGAALTYTLTYGNRDATSTVSGTTLSLPIPAGTTFVSATGGGSLVGSTVQWTLGSLPAGQSDQQQVVVNVNAGTAVGTSLVVNAATIAGTSLVPESAQATAVTRVASTPPLGLAIEMNPDPARPTEKLVAQLTVTNRGSTALTGVVLQARMPQGISPISVALVTGGATCIQANTSGNCDPNELLNWSIGTLPAGTGITRSVLLPVAAATDAGRLVTLEVLATDDGANKAILEDAAAVDSNNPLSLSVGVDKNPVAAGGTQTYTLSYANRASTSSINPPTLSFPIPAGTSFVSATGGGTLVGSRVQWALGSLPATQSGEVQVVVSVNGTLGNGTILAVNAASISGPGLVQESARATAISRVSANPPLLLAIEMNPDPVRPGELVTAQMTVTNTSGSPLTGVVLQARMPEIVNSIAIQATTGGATCIQANTSGSCDPGEFANWNLGTIPAGGGVTVSLPMIAAANTQGRLLTLETLVNDDGINRAVTKETVAVDADDPLTLAVDDDKNPVRPGDLLTYTLTYANRAATSSITGTTLSFPVPTGTTFVSATGGGTLSGSTVEWSIGSLPATQADQQQVVVMVNTGTIPGTPLVVNTAQLAGTDLFPESARANAITRVAGVSSLVLGIESNPDPARPGELLTNEITLSNRGSSPLTGVVLQLRMPQGVNSINLNATTLGGTCVQLNTSGSCDSNELATWNLGTIPAGTGLTVSVPTVVTASTSPGRLISLEVVGTDDGVNKAVLQQTVAVDNDNPLTLAVDENMDAVASGGTLTYTLTYGNRAATGSATGSKLQFPLPVEAVLLSSTGGSVVDGNVVWNLGSIPAGAGGRRMVRLSVPGTVNAGSLIRIDAAQLKGNVIAGQVPDAVRATVASRVEANKPLGLTLILTPDPVVATQTLTGTLSVTNNSGGTLTGVVLQARVPQSVNSFSPALLTGGGTCITVNTSGNCDFTELANWNLGTLTAGQSVSVTMPMVVTTGTANGRLISVESLVLDDSGRLSTMERTVLLNPFVDTDGDGVAQIYDNCQGVANPTQLDTNGDGYGNRCDPDFNNNGIVDSQDGALLKAAFGSSNFPDRDINGNGIVDSQDGAILKSMFGKVPGPSALAP